MHPKKLLTTLAFLFFAGATLSRAAAQNAPQEVPGKAPKFRVSQGVMERNIISKVTPVYPQEAKDARIQGDAILRVVIDREGNVASVNPVSGHPVLVKSAANAVKQWKYRPLRLNGNPVEVETTIRVQFRM